MSNIKDRVLMIASSRGINKVDFFKDLGLSYANFKGAQKQSSLSSDAVVTILTKYNDISPEWLVTGEGEMFKEVALARDKQENYGEQPSEGLDLDETFPFRAAQRVISSQEVTIRSQEKTIRSLEKQIEFLEREIKMLNK